MLAKSVQQLWSETHGYQFPIKQDVVTQVGKCINSSSRSVGGLSYRKHSVLRRSDLRKEERT